VPPLAVRSCSRPPGLPKVFARRVDNEYFPLRPGTTFTYRGREDGKPAKDVVTVTRRAKTILGVRITVVRDRVFVRDELAEDTLDWYAQDANGNVWYFGEDTKEYEDGRWSRRRVRGRRAATARAEIFMLATPKVGRTLKQEDAKNVAETARRWPPGTPWCERRSSRHVVRSRRRSSRSSSAACSTTSSTCEASGS
jgi:hypothetical protein